MQKKELRFCPYCAGPFECRQAEGRMRLVCTQCGEIYYQNPLPASTALVLDGQGRLLLGKRAVDPARGAWCLPGGFVEMGEPMDRAALRELEEETGLAGSVLSFLGCFFQESAFYGSIIIFGYRVAASCGALRAGDDMEELDWFALDSLPPVAFDAHRRLIDKLQEEVRGET